MNTELDFSKQPNLKNISISKALSLIAKPFDQDSILEKTYNKHYNNPDSEYYHLSKEEIKTIWETKGANSRRYGSLLDDYIGIRLTGTDEDLEMYKLDNDVDGDERLKGLIDSFDNFYSRLMQSGDVEFVTREQTVYYQLKNPNYGIDPVTGRDNIHENMYLDTCIKGRFDALFRNKKTGRWIIIDWKSSNSIDTSNRWEKLLGPAKDLDNCNYNTYTIQGYFYKTALLYGGYLPEGTYAEDIDFFIVQLPGFVIEDDVNFKIWKPAFKYDYAFMNKIFEFAVKKNTLLEREGKK